MLKPSQKKKSQRKPGEGNTLLVITQRRAADRITSGFSRKNASRKTML